MSEPRTPVTPTTPGDSVDGSKVKSYFSSWIPTKANPIEYTQEDFDKDGVNFKAKIMGSMEVDAAQGEKLCANALSEIKLKLKSASGHKQQVLIKIGDKGMTILDEKTGEKLFQHNANKISYLTPDRQDNRVFGLIYFVDKKHVFFAYKSEKNVTAAVVLNCVKDFFEHLVQKRRIRKEKEATQKNEVEKKPDPATEANLIDEKETKPVSVEEIKKQEILNLAGSTSNEIKQAEDKTNANTVTEQPAATESKKEVTVSASVSSAAASRVSILQPPPSKPGNPASNPPQNTVASTSNGYDKGSLDNIFSPKPSNANQFAFTNTQPPQAQNQPSQVQLDDIFSPQSNNQNQAKPVSSLPAQGHNPSSQTSLDDIFSPKPSSQGLPDAAPQGQTTASKDGLDDIFSPKPSSQEPAAATSSQALDDIFSPQPSGQEQARSMNIPAEQGQNTTSHASLDDIFSAQPSNQVLTSNNNRPQQAPAVSSRGSLDAVFSSQTTTSTQSSIEITTNQTQANVNVQLSMNDPFSQPAGTDSTTNGSNQLSQGQDTNKQVLLDDLFSSVPSSNQNTLPPANQPFISTSVSPTNNPFASQTSTQSSLEATNMQQQSLMTQNVFSGLSASSQGNNAQDSLLAPSSGFSNPFFGTNSRVNSRSNSPVNTPSPFDSSAIPPIGRSASPANPFNAGPTSGQVNYNAGQGLFLADDSAPQPAPQKSKNRQDEMDKAFEGLNVLGPKETKPQKSLPMSAMASQINPAFQSISSTNRTFQPIDTAGAFNQQVPIQKPSAFAPASSNNSNDYNNDIFGGSSSGNAAPTQQVKYHTE
ncbi:Protein disabled [Trichoplax sp. H2]|nr:Protein disabled [Trichoplax sp. H2]|eukprot:RDD43646.1 Protein disabled [Trichoplax sp. H2]